MNALIAERATRLANSSVDQTRLGPRTIARLLGVILLTSCLSATYFKEEGEMSGREEEEEGKGSDRERTVEHSIQKASSIQQLETRLRIHISYSTK